MSFLLRSLCFLFLVSSFLNTFVSPTQHDLCNSDQRDALLEFKTEFGIQKRAWVYPSYMKKTIPYNPKTKSWVNNSDCCSWDGITCGAKSGKVIGLDLTASCLNGRLESNSSLFRLRHLRDLNLAFNNFTDSPIPAELNKLKELERLNLSKSILSGQIPTELLLLTKLVSLDLSSSYFPYWYPQNSLSIGESFLPLLAQNLRNLRELDLSFVNISSKIPHELSNLWFLRSLDFKECSLFGEFPSSVLLMPNLQSINLDFNPNLRGNLPDFRGNNSLQILSLSDTSFSGTIPDSISNLKHLTSLELSISKFSGKIPFSLGNLSHLASLDLSHNSLIGEIPSSLGNLSHLASLDLSNNSFIGEIPSSLGNLSHLSYLDLTENNFIGEIPSSLGNLSHLSYLDLTENNFIGEIPSSIGNLKQLIDFYVSDNKLSGHLPSSLVNLTQLRSIHLGSNQFTGFLPPNISQLSKLETFAAFDNSFTGAIPSSLFKISSLTYISLFDNQLSDLVGIESISLLPNLQILDIGNNNYRVSPVDFNVFSPLKQLEGLSLSGIPLSTANITSDFQPHFEELYLSGCNITEFPEFLRNQRNLKYLYLSNNKIKGQVPDWLWRLQDLYMVDLSGIPLSTANITSDFLSNLEQLELRGCNITEFPEFLRNQRNLSELDLSNNKIKGQVPDWLWRLPMLTSVDLSNNSLSGLKGSLEASPGSRISYVDLSSNAFQGPIFIPSTSIKYYLASKNNFTGEIPRSICGLSSLFVLDLSNNNLHGSIPRCLETRMSSLDDLNLRNNSLGGRLPDIFINAKSLTALDVSHNRLVGKLPTSLIGCSSLEVLNVGNNQINDTFPFWLNSLQKLQVLVLRSNEFHGALHHPQVANGFSYVRIIDASHNDFTGTLRSDYFKNWKAMYTNGDNAELKYMEDGRGYYDSLVLMSKGIEMEMTRILTIYTAIDFSGNKIKGSIPESIGLLKGLRVLNLSSNGFTGNIPSSLKNLTKLESLDLSQNKLSGEIPPELGDMSSLEWVNVSHNQLVGSIPQGTQFQRQNCSSYEGNPGLYGPSLKDICGDKYAPTSPQPEPVESEEEEEEWFSWVAAGLGYAPGVVFGLTIRYIVVTNKHEWFMKTFGRNRHQSTRTR